MLSQLRHVLFFCLLIWIFSGNVSMATPNLAAKAKEGLSDLPSASVYIKKVIFTSAKYLSQRNRNKLVAPYIGQQLSTSVLEQLVRDVRAHYIMKGYPTTSVRAILDQEVQAGIIKLEIIHGFVKKIVLGKNRLRERLQIYTAFPFAQGSALYLPGLAQSIDQMNTVFSSNATLNILPSKSVGSSVIRVENIVKHPFRVELGGEKQGKSLQYKSNLGLDNLLAINDSWVVQYTSNWPFDKIDVKANPDSKRASSNSRLDTTFSSIFGTYSFSGSYKSSANHDLTTQQLFKNMYSRGTETFMLQIKKSLFHYRQHKLALSLGVTQKNKKASYEIFKMDGSAMPDSKHIIPKQTAQTRITNGVLGYSVPVGTGTWSSSVTYSFGAPLLADPSKSTVKETMYYEGDYFRQVALDINWGQLYKLPGNVLLSYQFKLAAQRGYALPGDEYFPISGMSGVRGLFQDVQTPSGITIRHEFTLPQIISFSQATAPWQPFWGFDWGRPLFSTTDCKNWLGWAFGFRYNAYGLNINAICSVPITPPDVPNSQDKTIVQGYKFHLFYALNCHELLAYLF